MMKSDQQVNLNSKLSVKVEKSPLGGFTGGFLTLQRASCIIVKLENKEIKKIWQNDCSFRISTQSIKKALITDEGLNIWRQCTPLVRALALRSGDPGFTQDTF